MLNQIEKQQRAWKINFHGDSWQADTESINNNIRTFLSYDILYNRKLEADMLSYDTLHSEEGSWSLIRGNIEVPATNCWKVSTEMLKGS